MDYTIENKQLKVTISDKGAELMSIFGKTTNFEYLWQGDAKYWNGRAYVLFPICGRLTEGKYTLNGKEYQMNLHGFARKTVYAVVDQKDTEITFGLKNDDVSYAQYPFEFDFKIRYALDGATLRTEMLVSNPGKLDLPFSVGGHPGFNIPLEKGLSMEDHYMEFANAKKPSKLIMSETCYYTGKQQPFPLKNDKILPLKHSMFDDDAIFLSGMDDTVTYKSDKSKRFVKVHFNDMTHLGFWHTPKTEAPFVCIEPWHGVPALDNVVDNFDTKLELIRIKPNEKYKTFIDITVNE